MINTIIVTNYLGDKLTIDLRNPEKSGFAVESIDGLGPGASTINMTEYASGDGAIFNSSRLPARNIVLAIRYLWGSSIEDRRQLSYRYFPIKRQVTLTIETDNRRCSIDGYVESNEPSIFSKMSGASISILCPNPYFYSDVDDGPVTTVFAGITPVFEFPFGNDSLTVPLLEFGQITHKTEKVILYEGDAAVGVTMTMHATGTATNVSIYNVTTREVLTIDTDKLALLTGNGIIENDTITISTVQGNKYISLLRDGEITNILNCLTKDSSWFKLDRGDNILAYTADTGDTNLQFKVEHRVIYEGV